MNIIREKLKENMTLSDPRTSERFGFNINNLGIYEEEKEENKSPSVRVDQSDLYNYERHGKGKKSGFNFQTPKSSSNDSEINQ